MLKQLVQASLVITGVAVLAGCNIDESFSTDATPAYTSGTQVVTVTRPVGSSPFRGGRINNPSQVVTKQTTVVVNQPVYRRPSAPARVVVARPAPVRRAPAASTGFQVGSAPQASTGFQADSAPASTGFQTGSSSDASSGFEVN